MSKTRISASELIWVFHEKLREYDDYPQQSSIPIAIVPQEGNSWRVVTSRAAQAGSALWAERIETMETALRKRYVLAR